MRRDIDYYRLYKILTIIEAVMFIVVCALMVAAFAVVIIDDAIVDAQMRAIEQALAASGV